MRLFLLVMLFLALPALAAADCPPAHFMSTYIPAHDFYASKEDTGLVGSPESVTVRYELTSGVAFLRRVAGLGGGGSTLDLVDDYTVSGPPDGTPVTLNAKLAAYGNAAPYSGSHGPSWTVTLGSGASSVKGGNVYQDWSQVLTLPLSVTAGTPFRVHFLMEIFGGFDSFEQNEGAALHFEGLPVGATISSCHGYLQGAVPTASTTWGSLKSRYR